MRLQVIDPNVNFSCSSCTRCCDQPWRTIVEPEKLAALEAVDWGAEFPQLAGRPFYRRVRVGRQTVFELSKSAGNRCIFLADDGLCIIHKKLGYDAKPHMCKQFPFFAARAWDADYVSANFGCKAVQRGMGPPLVQQRADIERLVPRTAGSANSDAHVLLAPGCAAPQSAARALLNHLAAQLGDAGAGALTDRLARVLAALETATAMPADRLADAAARGDFGPPPGPARYEPLASPATAPLPARFLLAATLFPDTLPPDSTADAGLLKRMTLVPKLMALTRLHGGYASRLLGRNVRVDAVLERAADVRLTLDATNLLVRYLQSRLWQQFPGGTRLPVFAGLHQHIIDLNAVLFYALAGAAPGARELDRDRVEHALMLVEFHLANQPRLYQQVLQRWLRSALASPEVAWFSLRMSRLAPAAAPQSVR
jgi:Fe-S-cluster containining protein